MTYDQDLVRWARETAELIRKGSWQAVDVEHLAEELEDLSKSERRAIASQLVRLLLHLLKWQYQSERRSDSWIDSITDARLQIELAIQDSPSLRSYPTLVLAQSYQRARRSAAMQTGRPLATFPETCPYGLDQVLDDAFLPESSMS
ncbi:DUF29 domain-containing protein [Thiocapsa bogorovii]|uniref:DUF29 domain-containing protein n=1 Tax=Thiocapsa bogorovii TaxID=521689 RepID=UPI001E5A0394|nr:DUF29 domain-containing protein [Thiocapsa bogorovii]UHD18953.1 DUF29 domain-containing protein [Thiocapsa bogorovii]